MPQPPPEPPGLSLRRAREARGLSLDELVRTTKISKSTLTALESGDIGRLPAAIYTRGFVKAYAHEVGLDPDATADEYLDRIESTTAGHHAGVEEGHFHSSASARHASEAHDDTRELLAANQLRRFGRLTTLVAAIGLVVYVVSFNRERDDEPLAATMPAATTPPDAARAADERAADEPAIAGGDVAAAVAALQLELVPQGPCWIVATVDGERVLARLLQRGERQSLAINEEALLRVGDPGALSISINGRAGRSLGLPGQPVDVKITKENFEEFLSS